MSEPVKVVTLSADELETLIKHAVVEALKADGRSEERLLDPEETAKLLSVTVDWLYHNQKHLPFTRKLGPKMLRFSLKGMHRWMDAKKFS